MVDLKTKDYATYSFEDFLQDDHFISSMVNPDEDSIAFWTDFLTTKPANSDEFLAAKSYINSFPVSKEKLSQGEINAMWNSIMSSNRKHQLAHRNKKYAFTILKAVVAACIIGVVFTISLTDKFVDKESDIFHFAKNTTVGDYQSSHTQLMLSEDNTIILDEKESVIVYDSTSIKTNGKEMSNKGTSKFNRLIVPKGKRSMLTLSDGTRLWINAGTHLIYPVEFDKKQRNLYVDGEIYIEVAHKEGWPFVIETKDIGINVLGTVFNVTAYESDAVKRVILISGSVKINNRNSPAAEDLILSPNKKYEYGVNAGFVETVDAAKFISWKDGMYLFENENLEVIVKRLSRYYGVDISIDKESAQLRCSGKLDLKDDLNIVLQGLAYAVPIRFEKLQDHYDISAIARL